MNSYTLVLASGIALIGISASAQAAPSDGEISKLLVGSWVVPTDSSDYGPENKYGLETFKADGTETEILYNDSTCREVVNHLTATWKIQKGVIVTLAQSGQTLRDAIVSIDDKKMTLHSIDDGTTYTREKGSFCGKPVS